MNAAPTTGLGETVLSSLNMVCRARGDQALWRGAGGLCPGRGEDCAGTLPLGLWDAENDCCERRYASDRHCPQVSFNYN